MTQEQLTEKLKAVCGPLLESVILYGSAAAGDHTGRRSNVNVLVLLSRLGVKELKMLSDVTRSWVKAGNPAPLLLTPEGLLDSADVFPLEIADIKDSHRILFGQDLVSGLPIRKENLRRQLEHELRGKLIQLRERYLLVERHPRQIQELLIRSLSSILVLLRGILRLYQPEVPAQKLEAVRMLAKHLTLPTEVFETIDQLKRGRKIPGLDSEQIFSEYLQAIELAVSALDKFSGTGLSQEG